jgi:hypothetical protein
MPEPLRLDTREAVEKHFRETHKETIIKQVESHTISGVAARNLRAPDLVRLVRQGWEDQRRFPLQLATLLSQKFASYGLQFFKVNKAITHVSVARPHFLDLEVTPVSEGVKRIVDFVNATPKCTRRKLMEALAPTPKKTPAAAPAAATEPAAEATSETSAEPVAAPVAPTPESFEPTAEQTTLIADLHWLIHQGHVIEFANGVMETAKKPLPKPPKAPKPETKAPEQKSEETAAAETAPEEVAPEGAAVESTTNAESSSAVPDLSSDQPTSQLAPEPAAETPAEVPSEPTAPGESPA